MQDQPVEMPDIFSDETMRSLAAGRLVWPVKPWKSSKRIYSHYNALCRDITRHLRISTSIEEYAYGQGYASFVGAFFYEDTAEFTGPLHSDTLNDRNGLWIALNLQTPYYVCGEGNMTWDSKGGGSYLPDIEGVDEFNTPAVTALSKRIERQLSKAGHLRLTQAQVAHRAPKGVSLDTNLGEGNTLFDILFHWID